MMCPLKSLSAWNLIFMLWESKPLGEFICPARRIRISCAQSFSNYLLLFLSFFKVFINFVLMIQVESQCAEDLCQSQYWEAFFLNRLWRQTFTPPVNNRIKRYPFSSNPINIMMVLNVWIVQFYFYVTHTSLSKPF